MNGLTKVTVALVTLVVAIRQFSNQPTPTAMKLAKRQIARAELRGF
jgi:hypothetical protein